MAGLTLDSGALIGYERFDPRVLAWLEEAMIREQPPTIPTAVIAETWRGGARSVRIARLVKMSVIENLTESLGREAGMLLARHRASAVDAVVVASAARRHDLILTSDAADVGHLATMVGLRYDLV